MTDLLANYGSHLQHAAIALIIMLPLERLLPRNRDQKVLRPHWRTDLAHALFNFLLITSVAIALAAGIITLLAPLIPAAFKAAIAAQPLWLQFIEVFVIADLYYYTMHYAAHKIPLLWRFHAVHHSIEDMDWLATHRVHPVDQILTGSATLIIPIAMGYSAEALILFSLQFSWHSLLKHSNVKVTWGPLRWIYCTPLFHHWHHSNEPGSWDKNFAGQLPLIDLVFGTANMTEHRPPEVYGVADPVPTDYVGQLAYPFREASRAPNTPAMTPAE